MQIEVKPIESVPKDGTWVILFGSSLNEPEVSAAFWHESEMRSGWYAGEAHNYPIPFEPVLWAELDIYRFVQ